MQVFLVLASVIVFVAGAPGSSRIIGGEPTTIEEFPFVVSISTNGLASDGHVCGGFIYSIRWVVTAASCFDSLAKENAYVIAGSALLNGGDQQLIPIQDVKKHTNYDPATKMNDVALVSLARPLVLSNTTQAIRYDELDLFSPLNGTILGWGETSDGGIATLRIRQGKIANLTADCRKYQQQYNANFMVCAGNDATSAVSPCKYDLGSPLIQEVNFNKRKERVVVGIFSKNQGCLDLSIPSVYTRISAYYGWLQQIAGQQPSGL